MQRKRVVAIALLICLILTAPSIAFADDTTVYVAKNTVKVYKTKSNADSVLGTMAFGESMTLISVKDKWAKVMNSLGEIGFCKMAALSYDDPNTLSKKMYALSDEVKAYRRPYTTSASVKLAKKAEITAVGVTSDGLWYRALVNGKFKYVQASDLKSSSVNDAPDISDETYPIFVSSNTATFYKKANLDSKQLGVKSFGDELICHLNADGWAKVENEDGDIGFCQSDNLIEVDPNTLSLKVFAIADSVKIYAKPLTTSSVVKKLSSGTSMLAVSITPSEKWYRVEYFGESGFVQVSEVTQKKIAGKLDQIVELAKNQLDKPYIYADEGPDSYDCTGLTQYCYKVVTGIILKRSALDQGYDDTYRKIENIAELRKGDVVYFNTNQNDADLSDHAGIYCGNGLVVHASSAAKKVITSSITSGYYNRVFSWGRRILP